MINSRLYYWVSINEKRDHDPWVFDCQDKEPVHDLKDLSHDDASGEWQMNIRSPSISNWYHDIQFCRWKCNTNTKFNLITLSAIQKVKATTCSQAPLMSATIDEENKETNRSLNLKLISFGRKFFFLFFLKNFFSKEFPPNPLCPKSSPKLLG